MGRGLHWGGVPVSERRTSAKVLPFRRGRLRVCRWAAEIVILSLVWRPRARLSNGLPEIRELENRDGFFSF